MGFLVNVAARSGVGVDGRVHVNHAYSRSSLRGRYRFWLADSTSLELASGVTFPRESVDSSKVGVVIGAAINFSDYVGVVAEANQFQLDGRRDHSLSVGLRLGAVSLAYLLGGALGAGLQADPKKPRWLGGE